MGNRFLKNTLTMNKDLIMGELLKIQESPFAKKTDKQLLSYEALSELYKERNKVVQPSQLVEFNKPSNRKCKLTIEQVKEIRKKYNPYVYGKERLAKEYGVGRSVIYRIIKGKSWKAYLKSG